MAAAGVCHSDLHVVDGEWERPAGVVMGHEGAAWVEALGEGVDRLQPGDLVVLAWTAPCGRCEACRRDEPWLCSQPDGSGHRLKPEDVRLHRASGEPIGAYSGIGTFGERQVVAASAAIKVDPRTPPDVAALIGCAVTTGIGAVRNTAKVKAGESVAVIGLGGVGLSAVMGAVDAGAHPVTAIDTSPAKLELAIRAGAHRTLLADEVAQVEPPDHVLECIGLVETVERAIDLVRTGRDGDAGGDDAAGASGQLRRLPLGGGRQADPRLELRIRTCRRATSRGSRGNTSMAGCRSTC